MDKLKDYFQNIRYASKIIFAASKKYFIFKMLLSILSSVLPYLPLFLWRELINALVDATFGEINSFLNKIWWIAALYCGTMLVQRLLDTVSDYLSFKYNDAIDYYLDNVMIDKVSSVDLAFFDSSDLNDKLNNSWSLIYSTKNMVTFIFDMFQKAIRLAISFSLMITLSLWLIPFVIVFCIPSVISDGLVNNLDYQFEKEYAKSRRKLEYYKDLFFEGARSEVRLYHLSEYFSNLYKLVWNQWDKAIHSKNIKVCIVNMISLILLTVNEIIIYVLSVARLIAGKIEVGDVAYYVSLLAQFRGDFTSLCYRINTFSKNSKELSDVRTFVEMKPLLEKGGTKVPTANPKIEFNNVSFRYPNAEKNVLDHCSFVINPGETVGLVGLNGSGKSTIVKLLCRFYDPSEGEILIDGIDSREYDIVKLRSLFAALFQDYVKYSFNLRENIALSDLSRIEDDAAIKQACDISNVSDFTKNWDNGVDENLTRRFDKTGKELSGGQWQRVALARAFFRNASIILLDEPSAALDPLAEHQIFEDFSKISKGKSAILISHRLSSITLADKILVLEDGHIIEQGTHRDLIEKNGRYAYLFNLQASKYV
jgi:ATP-binding cassette subfamily B protein